MKQNTAILDIGSSKVICLICSAQGRDSITVRGAGVKEYPGFCLLYTSDAADEL